MASLKEQRLAAVTSVAKHLGATVAQSADERDTFLVTGRKRHPVTVAMIKANEPEGSHPKPPRLRFDRVALGLLERLRASLQDDVPSGVAVVLTVTAPIRQDSKTTLAIEERVRELLGKRSGRVELTDTIHGNDVQIRLMRGGNTSTSRLAGFVHNRDSVPNILFDITRALLERIRQPFAAGSWLVLAIEDEPLWMKTYIHVCAQLFAKTDLQRVILVDSNAGVTTLDS